MSNREGTVTTRMGSDGGSGEMFMGVGLTLPSDKSSKRKGTEGDIDGNENAAASPHSQLKRERK